MELKESFAKQSGHWYSPDGTPRYTIVGKNGKERNTTVRDARNFGFLPSVTTILKLAAAPGLEAWKIGNAIMSALTLPRNKGESDESYIYRITRDSEERASRARETGTAIHGAIEKGDRGQWKDWVEVSRAAANEWAGTNQWDSERSFGNTQYQFGGKLDLSAPGFVLDFKTTDKPLDDLKLWPDHRRQLAAYRMGLEMPEARCAICYVSSTVPAARLIELTAEELEQGWEEFRALLQFWKAANKWPTKSN